MVTRCSAWFAQVIFTNMVSVGSSWPATYQCSLSLPLAPSTSWLSNEMAAVSCSWRIFSIIGFVTGWLNNASCKFAADGDGIATGGHMRSAQMDGSFSKPTTRRRLLTITSSESTWALTVASAKQSMPRRSRVSSYFPEARTTKPVTLYGLSCARAGA